MKKHKKTFLITLLLIGIAVEGTNLQSLFFGFMTDFREHWYAIFNHIAALALASFWLLGIVYTGSFGYKVASWVLAVLTMVVSLYVYKDIASFSIANLEMTHRHWVVLLQSVVLPYFVAYYTHQLYELENQQPTKAEELISEIKEAKKVVNSLADEIATEIAPLNFAPTEQKKLGQRSIMNNAGITIRPFSQPAPKPDKTHNTPIVEDLNSEESEKKS